VDLGDLVRQHHELAGSIAASIWRQAPHAMEREELRSIANLALVLAAQRWPTYCQERGYSPDRLEYFVPYATRRMRGAIIDTLRQADYATRSQRSRAKQLREAGSESGATEDELSDRTGMSRSDIRDTLGSLARRPVSLDVEDSDSHPVTSVEGDFFVSSVLQSVTSTVGSLSLPQQAVLALHYFAGMELKEVASVLDITESRASHLHTDAVLLVHSAMARVVAYDRAS
jgi:RNA polymerase sigma factor for flagellar operon FliA